MGFRMLDRMWNIIKCSQEIRSDLVLAINVHIPDVYLVEERRKHDKCNH